MRESKYIVSNISSKIKKEKYYIFNRNKGRLTIEPKETCVLIKFLSH